MPGFDSSKHSVMVADITKTNLSERHSTVPPFIFMLEVLHDIGMIAYLHDSATAPTSNRDKTVWHIPQAPYGRHNGQVKLWNGSTWVDAASNPGLWAAMLTEREDDGKPHDVHDGTTVPSNAIGRDGDWYVRTGTNMTLYWKKNGVWTLVQQSESPHPSFATAAQATAGTDNTTIMTPLRVKNVANTMIAAALPVFATQAQAQAGTDNSAIMTPLRVKQAITAYGMSGMCSLGTVADVADTDYVIVCVGGAIKRITVANFKAAL